MSVTDSAARGTVGSAANVRVVVLHGCEPPLCSRALRAHMVAVMRVARQVCTCQIHTRNSWHLASTRNSGVATMRQLSQPYGVAQKSRQLITRFPPSPVLNRHRDHPASSSDVIHGFGLLS